MRMMLLTASLLVGLSPMSMAGQIYKWVDAQGVTHFGAQPPQGVEATTVGKSATPAPKPLPPHQAGSLAIKGHRPTGQKRGCRAGSPTQGVLRTGPDQPGAIAEQPQGAGRRGGEMRRLTDEERRQRIDETRQQIEEHCQ